VIDRAEVAEGPDRRHAPAMHRDHFQRGLIRPALLFPTPATSRFFHDETL
jgi:hypothetical protein